MKMAGELPRTADNVVVRIEAADGAAAGVRPPRPPTMTGDTLGGLVAAVRDHLAAAMIWHGWLRCPP